MIKFTNSFKPLALSTTLLLAGLVGGCGDSNNYGGGGYNGGGSNPSAGAGPTGGTCTGSACVDLGTAANYSVLAESAITTTGTTVVNGNVGLSPAAKSDFGGWSQADDSTNTYATSVYVVAPGKMYASNHTGGTTPADLTLAIGHKDAAYAAAAAKPTPPTPVCPGTGAFDGTVVPALAPGVYTCAVNVTIPNSFTLNGSATDVWVFQITGTLTQAANTQIILTGGALPRNVFWQVSDVVAIGADAVMQGIVLGFSTISMGSGASVNGRLLGNTDITFIANTVTLP